MATLRDQADERHAQLRVYKEMRDHKLANVFSFHFTFVQRTLAAVTGPTERLHLLLRRSSAGVVHRYRLLHCNVTTVLRASLHSLPDCGMRCALCFAVLDWFETCVSSR